MENPEYFGNEFQVALQEKCLKAWPDLATNPRINFSGLYFDGSTYLVAIFQSNVSGDGQFTR